MGERGRSALISYRCFPPNTLVPYTDPVDGQMYDVDWIGGTTVEYGAVTARSYHPGGVNALFVDGSVRFIPDSIPQATWRALCTRNGGEVIGDFDRPLHVDNSERFQDAGHAAQHRTNPGRPGVALAFRPADR